MGGGSEAAEVQYLVLPNSTNPFLLARVRWPDVAEAISAGIPTGRQIQVFSICLTIRAVPR